MLIQHVQKLGQVQSKLIQRRAIQVNPVNRSCPQQKLSAEGVLPERNVSRIDVARSRVERIRSLPYRPKRVPRRFRARAPNVDGATIGDEAIPDRQELLQVSRKAGEQLQVVQWRSPIRQSWKVHSAGSGRVSSGCAAQQHFGPNTTDHHGLERIVPVIGNEPQHIPGTILCSPRRPWCSAGSARLPSDYALLNLR